MKKKIFSKLSTDLKQSCMFKLMSEQTPDAFVGGEDYCALSKNPTGF